MDLYEEKSLSVVTETIQKLLNIFQNNIDPQIIESVAWNCKYDFEASVEALLHLSSTERIEPDSTTNTTEDDSNSDSVIASEKKFIDENAIPDNEDHKNTFDSKITTLECNNMVQEITNAISENKIMVLEKKVSESLNQIQNNNLYSNITSLPTTSSFTRHYKTPQRRKPSPQELAVEYLKNLVLKGTKLLVIMRGLPGSGKSSLARLILKSCYPNKNFNLSLLSTDDYFLKGKNTYVYDVTKLQYAHAWNQSRAAVALQQGLNPVVIDNTNLEYWEMQPYILLGKNMGYTIEILEPFTSWAFKVNELAKRNTHGVPKEKIKSMLTRYDKSMLTLNKKISSNPNAFLIPEEINTSEVITKSELKSCQNFNLGSHEETFFGDSGGDTQNTKNRFENTYEESKDNDLGIEAKSFNSFSDSSNLNVLNEPDDEENSNSDVWKSNEETLRSWDLTSVADVTVFYPVNLKKDNFAFTDPHDFLIANYEMNTDLKILYSNGNFQPARINDVFDRKPLSKLSLEKGTMTEDKISDDNINKEADLNKLYDLFPYLQKDVVNDVFEKCSCDIDWTADILLDSNQEIGKISQNQSFTSESSSNDFLSCETSRSENFNTNEATVQSSDDNEMEFNDLSNNLKPEGDIVNLNKQQAQDEQFTFVQTPNFFECNTIFQDFEDDNSKNFDDEVEDLPGTSQSPEVSVESEGEFFELNLGSNLIEQLESKFGDETFKYPKGFLPVVQIPVDLGRQLYAFYLESVYQQLDVQNQILNSVVKEDEEFAKKLQAIEFDQAKLINNTECPNLKIIMEEEAKMGNFAKQEKLKKNNEENLALILTKVKLFENFPNIEKKVVAEVLNEQDNHYEKAVEVLSTMKPMVRDSLVDTESWEDLSVDVVQQNTYLKTKSFSELRKEAFECLKLRNELFAKANEFYQKKMRDVALYYSGLAKDQTQKCNYINNLAVSVFLNEQKKVINNTETLDLHYLKTKEALVALDIFLDKHITSMQKSKVNRKYLCVITGRGNRSVNGQAKIKPLVVARLLKRNIRFTSLNPGLLRLEIKQNSNLSPDFYKK